MAPDDDPSPRPICANCGSTMSDRQGRTTSPRAGRSWFCPGCADYDSHLPTIYPSDPVHPEFLELAEDDFEMLEGCEVIQHKPSNDHGDFVGTISEVRRNAETGEPMDVLVVNHDEFPFNDVSRWIEWDRFNDVLWTPRDPVNPGPVPDKEVLTLG